MERLTRRSDTGHAYYPHCFAEPCGGNGCKIKDCLFDNTICERLAKYEDTGLEPAEVISMSGEWNAMMSVLNSIGGGYDRLLDLAEADKDGRVVVLPVRPVLTQSIRSMLYIIEDGEIVEDSLCEALVGMGSNGEINTFYTTLSDQISFEQADIGKTVFLTREEAEKALEDM